MASFISIFTAFLLLQVVHSEEYCAMYEVCGKRSTDGVVLNCPYGSPSVKPDKLFSARIQSLCPTLTGNVCCTELQFESLRLWVDPATRFLGGCPACLRNYLNLFCELSCSPNQSLYINVTSVSKVSGNMTVAGIDYYISDTFGQGLYNSCKDVKFRSIDLVGAGAKSFEEWFDFLGKKASPAVPASPYAIDFRFPTRESSEMQFMNMSAYSCADTLLGCSCDDCPNACSSSEVMLLTIKLWPVEVTINVTRIVATFMAVLWDCSQLAWGMANLMGICSLWMVTVLWGIIWNFKFLLGLAIGYLYAHFVCYFELDWLDLYSKVNFC